MHEDQKETGAVGKEPLGDQENEEAEEQGASQEIPEADPERQHESADFKSPFPKIAREWEQDKKIINEFNATGNTARIQLFVQSLNYNNKPQESKAVPQEKPKKGKGFRLEKASECIRFVEEYKEGEYLALALIVAVFDNMSLSDLPQLQSDLIKRLPATAESKVEEEDQKRPPSHDPYLSLNSKLAVIGASVFIQPNGQRCVGFGEKADLVLANLWEQFSYLRTAVVGWLLHTNQIYTYRTSVEAQQIIKAFTKVISLDFSFAEKEIFPRLYSDPTNMGFLGALANALYLIPETHTLINKIVLKWIDSSSEWLWQSAFFAYAALEDAADYQELELPLKGYMKKNFSSFSYEDVILISLFATCSSHTRTFLAELFHRCFKDARSRADKVEIASIYLGFVRYAYYQLESDCTQLSLVACDSREQQHFLTPVLSQVLGDYRLRKQLFFLLRQYLENKSGSAFSDRTVKHLAAYFQNMMIAAPAYCQDIREFLKTCQGDVSKRIYGILQPTGMQKNGGISRND